MPSAAHAAKLNELCPRKRSLALALAVCTSLAVTIYFMLYMCYKYGAGNFRSWFFQPGAGAGGVAFDWVVYQLRDPQPTDWGKLTYLGLGALIYSLLSLCQYRFHWWPSTRWDSPWPPPEWCGALPCRFSWLGRSNR